MWSVGRWFSWPSPLSWPNSAAFPERVTGRRRGRRGRGNPGPLFRGTTTTGGGMDAHVWTPYFLRQRLSSSLLWTGWSKDWYAGFPVLPLYFPAHRSSRFRYTGQRCVQTCVDRRPCFPPVRSNAPSPDRRAGTAIPVPFRPGRRGLHSLSGLFDSRRQRALDHGWGVFFLHQSLAGDHVSGCPRPSYANGSRLRPRRRSPDCHWPFPSPANTVRGDEFRSDSRCTYECGRSHESPSAPWRRHPHRRLGVPLLSLLDRAVRRQPGIHQRHGVGTGYEIMSARLFHRSPVH